MNAKPTTPVNAISVDVEDWLQSTVDPNLPLTDRFHHSTRAVLEAFESHGVTGSFFILGLAAEKAPELVREIQVAGHEIQSHGYGHELVHTLAPEEFRADLDRSKKLLEDMTGQPVTGYRAPAFTITLQNLWALDMLVECGYTYDSSVFPLETSRYGIDGAPWFPHRLKTPAGYELLELPVASFAAATCCHARHLPSVMSACIDRRMPCRRGWMVSDSPRGNYADDTKGSNPRAPDQARYGRRAGRSSPPTLLTPWPPDLPRSLGAGTLNPVGI